MRPNHSGTGASRNRAIAGLLVCAALIAPPSLHADEAQPLRLCADPTNLPFSSDSPSQPGFYVEIGQALAQALGRPVATGLKGLAVEDGAVRCEQEVAGGRDVYRLALPAVVTVLEGINLPRYPSVPAKLRARQKPIETVSGERPQSRLEKLRLVVPEGQGKQADILGQGPGAAPAVVEVMKELGVA